MAAQDEQHLYSLPYERLPAAPDDYESLINKPKINGHTLEGDQSASDLGINVPTKASDLDNDVHYATESQIPTQLSQLANNVGFTTQAYVDDKITNVRAAIPTKTSDLTNDSGFITSSSLPTKTSDLTNDSDFTTKTYVDDKVSSINTNLSKLNNTVAIKTLLGESTFTSTFDNLATAITTAVTAIKAALQTGEKAEIHTLRINTIGNVSPSHKIIVDASTTVGSIDYGWQGVSYYNNVLSAIDVVNKKVLSLTMTNDLNDDAFVTYFSDNTTYTFTIEYSVYKTITIS